VAASAPSGLSNAAREKLDRLGDAVQTVDRLLFRMGQQGLSRLSGTSVTELRALVQTAHNARMVTIERELEALATQVQRYLDRDPLFRSDRYLASLNRLWLLNHRAGVAYRKAVEEQTDVRELTDVLGEARRTYTLVEEPLELQALGARGWLTDSDFVGVTVWMRRITPEGPGEILQVSNARPASYFGTDPRRLMRMGLSEYVDVTIQSLSHGAFVFHDAKRSADGRLSVYSGLEVVPSAWRGAMVYADCTVDRWDGLAALLRDDSVHPVRGGRGRLVLVEPVGMTAVETDEKRQEARCTLLDGRDAALLVRVPLRPENNLLVDNLETLVRRPELRPPAFFGRASAVGGQLVFEPMTAVYGVPVTLRTRPAMTVNEVHLTVEDLERVKR
jgi:hypothetical protein